MFDVNKVLKSISNLWAEYNINKELQSISTFASTRRLPGGSNSRSSDPFLISVRLEGISIWYIFEVSGFRGTNSYVFLQKPSRFLSIMNSFDVV